MCSKFHCKGQKDMHRLENTMSIPIEGLLATRKESRGHYKSFNNCQAAKLYHKVTNQYDTTKTIGNLKRILS